MAVCNRLILPEARSALGLALIIFALSVPAQAQPASLPYVEYIGNAGPGLGKRIVFLAGDEEYRSEEGLPMLAQILARRQGFTCTVLFSQDSATGQINPDNQNRIAGTTLIRKADLVIMLLRFREWSDKDMEPFVAHLNSGKPVIGLRTSTHAFLYEDHPESPFAKYGMNGKPGYPGGFGRQVLGETWIDHYGAHGSQSTRGLPRESRKTHPILKGVADIWGPTDVYKVTTLNGDADVLMDGQVLAGMQPGDAPAQGKVLMPIAWTKTYTGDSGKTCRIFTTTMGASVDLENEGLRRMIVNAAFWSLGMEAAIPEKADVTYVSPYVPTPFGMGTYKKGVRPQDFAWSVTGLSPRMYRQFGGEARFTLWETDALGRARDIGHMLGPAPFFPRRITWRFP